MNLPEQMANKFNRKDQVNKLMEELGECIAAASRLQKISWNDDYDIKQFKLMERQFVDEIIDVEFLFAQMRHYFDGFEEAKDRNDAEVKARFF